MADGNYSSSESTNAGSGGIRKEIMLFGVRLVLDPMRKSVSLNNLSDYEQMEETPKIDGGYQNGEDKNKTLPAYASADEAVPVSSSNGTRERKRGVPWSEEEHKLFLLGLQRVGKGDWKGISRNFVKSRTSTQVASHAQKYFLRRSNLNRRRRRSSLFDMTTDTVMPMKEDQVVVMQDNTSQSSSPAPGRNNLSMHQATTQVFPEFSVVQASSGNNASGNQSYGSSNRINLVPYTFQSRPVPPSLNLSLASPNLNEPSSSSMYSAFNTIGVA